MTIDELIAQLKQLKYEHGNVPVTVPKELFYSGLEFTEKPVITYKEDSNEVVIF